MGSEDFWDRFRQHFPDSEILCRCDLGHKCPGPKQLHRGFAEKLLATRLKFNIPMLVTSGIRCPYWNEKQGGVADSYHPKALAVDIRARGGAVWSGKLIMIAIECGIMGIGIRGGKSPIVHLDGRESSSPQFFGY
jgi:hypothetical protein